MIERVEVLRRCRAHRLEAVAHAPGHEHLRALHEAGGHDRAARRRVGPGVDVRAERLTGDDRDELEHVLAVQAADRALLGLGDVHLEPRAERREAGLDERALAVELADDPRSSLTSFISMRTRPSIVGRHARRTAGRSCRSDSFRRHADAGVHADHLAVEVVVAHELERERREVVGGAQPLREQHRLRERGALRRRGACRAAACR